MPRKYVRTKPYARKKAHNKPPLTLKLAEDLFRQGNSHATVAEALGVAKITVIRWANQYGWERD